MTYWRNKGALAMVSALAVAALAVTGAIHESSRACTVTVAVTDDPRWDLLTDTRAVTTEVTDITGITFDVRSADTGAGSGLTGADITVGFGDVHNADMTLASAYRSTVLPGGRIVMSNLLNDTDSGLNTRLDRSDEATLPDALDPSRKSSMRSLLRHEMGHLLGLGHSTSPASVMNPTLAHTVTDRNWDTLSIERLQQRWKGCSRT